jgi:hypothetical protein
MTKFDIWVFASGCALVAAITLVMFLTSGEI